MFSLPTPHVTEGLKAVAVESGAKFQLLVCSRIGAERESFSVYTPQSLEQLSLEGPWQYFVRDLAITPEIPPPEPLPGVGWPAAFSINGLILLHHPDPASKSERGESSLGVTHRVVNMQTGERLEHAEYDTMFRALKREFQARARMAAQGK
jgi:hypothetical protein